MHSSQTLPACHTLHALTVCAAIPAPMVPQVDRIIAQRAAGGRQRYLVKWQGLEYVDTTWEVEGELRSKEDKVGGLGG
jgi:hypothetical protein